MSVMYEIYATETFKELYSAAENHERIWIDKTKEKLKEQSTGKPLSYSWFREKKYGVKRLYFLIDEEQKKILFLSFSSKKEQSELIAFVKTNMQELLALLKKL